MTNSLELIPTACPICKTLDNADEVYPANFDLEAFNPTVFSARRLPDRVHYRLCKCRTCGLVRSDPIAPQAKLSSLYEQSEFTYGEEVSDLRHTYGHYLASLDQYGARRDSLLEVGCGNGFFLEQALALGYQDVWGVEPSESAVKKAAPVLSGKICCDIMRPGLFASDQFDVVCMFQVFDHVPDPASLLDECFRVLKPGGLILSLNHNVDSISSRILRERSPIVDIEHTCLYSPRTMDKIFSSHRFDVLRVSAAFNRYSLYYLVRLLPLPTSLKRALLGGLRNSAAGRIRTWMPLGNLCLVARKPLTNQAQKKAMS